MTSAGAVSGDLETLGAQDHDNENHENGHVQQREPDHPRVQPIVTSATTPMLFGQVARFGVHCNRVVTRSAPGQRRWL